MNTRNSATELIQRRISCRSYTGESLKSETRQALETLIGQAGHGVFNSNIRFSLAAAEPGDNTMLKELGTYGFIKGAAGFVIAAVDMSEKNLEDFGYVMEKVILGATDLGLGTCWLGGSFNKSTFAEKIACSDDECVPAVAAVGYTADSRRLFDSTVRLIAGSSRRKPFEKLFFNGDFGRPLDPQACGPYANVLDMVRLGPSASNKQPWRIIRDKGGDVFHLYLERTRNYYENNQRFFGMMDIQRIDMGIAMCHFELACREAGLPGHWSEDSPPALSLPLRTSYVASWNPD